MERRGVIVLMSGVPATGSDTCALCGQKLLPQKSKSGDLVYKKARERTRGRVSYRRAIRGEAYEPVSCVECSSGFVPVQSA